MISIIGKKISQLMGKIAHPYFILHNLLYYSYVCVRMYVHTYVRNSAAM